MTDQIVDATTVEHEDDKPREPSREIVPAPPALAVTPTVKATELVQRLDVIRDAMHTAMQRDVDYGVIPGTGSKPTLLKPGAEKLGVLFQLDVQLTNEETWGPGDHYRVKSTAVVFHAPTGARLGSGEGLCSTREKKYAKRTQDRLCPECGKATIKRSKYPPRDNPAAEPGWYCFAKIGGCGANFAAADAAITSQPLGEIENPELPDTWNTVLKMAEKRARIDAVLAVTGASALFTQDIEDQAAPVESDVPFTPEEPAPPAPEPPLLCSPEQYHAALQAYSEAQRTRGLTLDEFIARLDAVGAPASEQPGTRVTGLPRPIVDELIDWLKAEKPAA